MIPAVFLCAFDLYLRTLAPAVVSGDTAEMLACGLGLDVAHAPGYPLLAMLVRLAQLIPAGGPAFRAGLVSAAAVAGACAFLFAATRNLSGSRLAGAAAAAVFALAPVAWEQATMIEKYGVQLLLASMTLWLLLGGASRWLAGAAGFALAFGHHPMAVFLLPPLVAFSWRPLRSATRGSAARAVLTAVLLAALAVSVRLVYPAIRGDALRHAEGKGERVINWHEPGRFSRWSSYVRLAPYADRFDPGTRVEAPTLSGHLSVYPAQLGWAALLLALAGGAWLAARDLPVAAGLAGVWLVSFPFNLRYLNPVSLVAVYHQTEILVLALMAGLGLAAVARNRPARVAAAAALLGWTAFAGRMRLPACDASRNTVVHDFNAAQLAALPPRAVFLSATNIDLLAVDCFTRVLGRFGGIVPLPLPHKEGPERFIGRTRYRARAAGLLPGARLDFDDGQSGREILDRLLAGDGGTHCFAASGLSAAWVDDGPFVPAGLALRARGKGCPPAGAARGIAAFRRASSRSWFIPVTRVPVNRTALDYWSLAYLRAAGATGDARERLALLAARTRMVPDDASSWTALAAAHAQAGRHNEAVQLFRRAVEADPASIEARLGLFRLLAASPDTAALAVHLNDTFAESPLRGTPSARAVVGHLTGGRVADAATAATRAFAESALGRAEGLPANPELLPARIALLRMAVALEPGWNRARESCAGALLDAGMWGEARTVLLSAVDRAPESPGAWFLLARSETALRRPAAARAALSRFLALVPGAADSPAVRELEALLAAPPKP